MSAQSVHACDLSRVTLDLVREFDGILSVARVRAEVRGAERDLAGQVVPESLDEMAHRLARYRLSLLTPDRRAEPDVLLTTPGDRLESGRRR